MCCKVDINSLPKNLSCSDSNTHQGDEEIKMPIYFDPVSSEVYDRDKKLIGHGELNGNWFTITHIDDEIKTTDNL